MALTISRSSGTDIESMLYIIYNYTSYRLLSFLYAALFIERLFCYDKSFVMKFNQV